MESTPPSPPSFTPRRRWVVGCDMAARTVLVLAVLVMINYLAGRFFHREFLSSQTRTDLSPRTRNLVHSLTNDIKITLYYNRDDDLFSTVSALLREYQALNPHLRVETVDYLRDAVEAQRVKLAYKLPETQQDEDKNFIIFDAGNGFKAINGNLLADYQVEVDKERRRWDKRPVAFKGEMLVNSGLLAVSSARTLKAYTLVGHGEHDFQSGDEVNGYRDFWSVLAQSKIAVEPLALTGTNIPADCDLLIVAGPRSAIPNEDLEKIDQHLNEGGRLFALLGALPSNIPAGWNAFSAAGMSSSARTVCRTSPIPSTAFGPLRARTLSLALSANTLSSNRCWVTISISSCRGPFIRCVPPTTKRTRPRLAFFSRRRPPPPWSTIRGLPPPITRWRWRWSGRRWRASPRAAERRV